jgi:hypothetical protein
MNEVQTVRARSNHDQHFRTAAGRHARRAEPAAMRTGLECQSRQPDRRPDQAKGREDVNSRPGPVNHSLGGWGGCGVEASDHLVRREVVAGSTGTGPFSELKYLLLKPWQV